MQCVKLGPGSDAKDVSPEMFDSTKQKDIRWVQSRVVVRGTEWRGGPANKVDIKAQGAGGRAGCRQLEQGARAAGACVCAVAGWLLPPVPQHCGSLRLLPNARLPRRQTKLRVVLVGPPKPPSPVPEGVEEPTSPATLGYKDAPSSGTVGECQRGFFELPGLATDAATNQQRVHGWKQCSGVPRAGSLEADRRLGSAHSILLSLCRAVPPCCVRCRPWRPSGPDGRGCGGQGGDQAAAGDAGGPVSGRRAQRRRGAGAGQHFVQAGRQANRRAGSAVDGAGAVQGTVERHFGRCTGILRSPSPRTLHTPPPPCAHMQPTRRAPGGFGVLHLLLVAVLAFLIGHFANVALPLLTEKLRELQAAAATASQPLEL